MDTGILKTDPPAEYVKIQDDLLQENMHATQYPLHHQMRLARVDSADRNIKALYASITALATKTLTMSGAQFLSRRIWRAAALRLLNRRFAFAIAAIAILSANYSRETYKHLPQQDVEYIEDVYKHGELEDQRLENDIMQPTKCTSYLRLFVGFVLAAQAICTIARPTDHSLIFMSWTLPLMPFVDVMFSTPSLAGFLAMSGNANDALYNTTALSEPIPWAWLPNNTSLQGFQDWYETDKEHYSASNDPLKLSNLDEDLLLPLRANLDDVPIRHILLLKLESTRKDVFPIKKNGYIWNRLAQSFQNSSLPAEAQERLSSLTSTAKYLTGDFGDGFGEKAGTPRGGINANNAFTTSTYTLKSLVGTHCGISPLAADFNVETDHHIYQPCLPHIFEALNQLNHSRDEVSDEHFTSYKWKTAFMQSVTLRYDKQDQLMPKIGFTDPLGWWELKDEAARLGPVDLPDINYYGMPEQAVEDYLRDTFASAKKNNERVFLSHLTSSTHHDFGLPEDEKYVPLAGDPDLDDLSHYLNTVGYVDRWLDRILQILDEEGVADETLLVAVGDHGLSIAERGTITPYSNPHVANYHVPLVLSHPKLPSIDVDDPVSSIQILPTILDLLLETKSLSKSEAEAVRDMIQNYEGQSLIRPMQNFSETNGQGGWQHTVMNPGGSTIAVRDARRPNWRLIVPVFGNYEWRFTDLETDLHEDTPLVSYDYRAILRIVEEAFGAEAATWVEEAATVTRWWTDENYKRWRYNA
ncbi:hypothetical protein MKX08_002422 [Trichoderma sp. CBMAI-0020]|nr:hypothetical protein MKX08_002422 [Trichoderma sp. CBMAI-0020]